jgi:hypothetical protein
VEGGVLGGGHSLPRTGSMVGGENSLCAGTLMKKQEGVMVLNGWFS